VKQRQCVHGSISGDFHDPHTSALNSSSSSSNSSRWVAIIREQLSALLNAADERHFSFGYRSVQKDVIIPAAFSLIILPLRVGRAKLAAAVP